MGWSGTAFGIAGALCIALNAGWEVLGFTLFLASSCLWSLQAHVTGQRNLLALNLVFSATNLMGLIRWSM